MNHQIERRGSWYYMKRTLISGTGSYIPQIRKGNQDFLEQAFYNGSGSVIATEPEIIIATFQKITGITERRYSGPNETTSDMAAAAGALALQDSGINGDDLDLLIVAHNFGDVRSNDKQQDTVPALASRVKNRLGIKSPRCIAFDTLFGCPGWLLGVMQADAFFKAGMAKKALVIGAETLSRVIDPFDRDSMIFSDGAGATVLEFLETEESGILHSSALSHCGDELSFLQMDHSYNQVDNGNTRYMKMKGRKVYEYALKHVPEAMKECLDGSGASIDDLKKIFIHQANEKMDEAIVEAFYKLSGKEVPQNVMPMCIHWLGNSSVATIPTLYDLVTKGQDCNHEVNKGDLIMFASVGAGMNINAVCYRC